MPSAAVPAVYGDAVRILVTNDDGIEAPGLHVLARRLVGLGTVTVVAPDREFEDTNPLCGDELKVQLHVGEDGRVTEVGFTGHGCAISQAAASMASEEVVGMHVDELVQLDTPEYAGRIRKELVIEKLLATAGVRLAAVLNEILDPEEEAGVRVWWDEE